MYPKTTFISKMENFIDADEMKKIISEVNAKIKSSNHIQPIKNPVIRYLHRIAVFTEEGDVLFDPKISANVIDEVYFNFTASLLDYLKDEIDISKDYRNEVISKVFGIEEGKFFSKFAELISAGILKARATNPRFNSAKDEGMPDVVTLSPIKIAHDSKLYPDEEIIFNSKIYSLPTDLIVDLGQFQNIDMQMFVKNVYDIKYEDIKRILAVYKFTGKAPLPSAPLSLVSIPYAGDQGIMIRNNNTNASLRFIPSIPMDKAVDDFQKSLLKAIKQIENSDASGGIVWAMFSHDDNNQSKRRLVHDVTKTIEKHKKTGYGLNTFFFRPVNSSEHGLNIQYGFHGFNLPKKLSITNRDFECMLDVLDLNKLY